jgi:DNA-binding MarR family transcriptional regulator
MITSSQPYLTFKLDLAKTLISKAADPYYERAVGLRIRELRVLRLIHDFPGIAAKELVDKIVLDKTLLSKNLAALEMRGLIRKGPDRRDGRRQCLDLTEEGLRAWRVCEDIGRRLESEMFAEISEADWNRLHELLDRVITSFEHWTPSLDIDENS